MWGHKNSKMIARGYLFSVLASGTFFVRRLSISVQAVLSTAMRFLRRSDFRYLDFFLIFLKGHEKRFFEKIEKL